MIVPDPRVNAYRESCADIRLKGQVKAERFVEGKPAQVCTPVADIRSMPSADAGLDTQLLLGENVRVFDQLDGWSWVQSERDGYVGYTLCANLDERMMPTTHRVVAPRTFIYRGPDLKSAVYQALSMGSALACGDETETRGTGYRLIAGGAVIASHVAEEARVVRDYVNVAERLVFTPYLWGGTSAFGLDCSGLVQLSMRMAGKTVLRDTDMQAASIGAEIDPGKNYGKLERGDLVFWKGHVAIMQNGSTMIHASGHTMMVSIEPLSDAVRRIGYLYGKPTICRRP